MYFDSHCHLTDQSFEPDRAEVLARARAEGVGGMVTICSDARDLDSVIELTDAQPDVWGTAGIHPHEARHGTRDALDRVRESLEAHPRLRAVGECGLDFHYDHSPREAQQAVFRAQLEMAEEVDLPVVVHARDADAEVAHMIREHRGRVIGVLHCFSGGSELLEVGLDAGWYVSFAGIVTFRSFQDRALVRAVPRERLLVETDSPYLAPVPHRGKRNEPGHVVRVAEAVAQLRDEPVEEVAAFTAENARVFFGIGRDAPG
jgi:TatD DNase family protein